MIVTVKVKPNARASEVVVDAAGAFEARLRSPPVDGKANEELVGLLARHFGCAKSAVKIRSGAGSRTKRVEVAGQ